MTSLLTRLGAIGFLAFQIGCSGDTVETKEATDKAPEEQTTGSKDKLDLNALGYAAVNKAELVPSPIDMDQT